jgi:eukaryotic-like serine/threonine-protein kinase
MSDIDATLDRLRRLASYGIQRQGELARGGMAVVEAVVDPGLQRRMARKLLSDELLSDAAAVSYFVREAHVTAQLEHPNIVPVHSLGVDEAGRPWFTMKLVDGVTLQERVERRDGKPPDRAELEALLDVLLRVCDALQLAHSRGVVHCDLKPLNIMVGDFGQVYLMDWGIARIVTPARLIADPGATQERPVASFVSEQPVDGVVGTPAFMAPEQAAAGRLDERTDVFGLGTLLYFVLSGVAPFEHPHVPESMRRALNLDYEHVGERWPGVPPGLVALVDRAMARDPRARYPSVGAFAAAVRAFLNGDEEFPYIRVPAGEHVVREGEVGDAAYVVVRGRCQVYTHRAGTHVALAELGPGEVFGETAILAETVRTASVVAVEETSLRRITSRRWRDALGEMSPWMRTFLGALARRFADQLEATEGTRRLRPAQVLEQVLMNLMTWGHALPAGGRAMSFSELATRIGDLGVGRRALAAGLSSLDEVEVDLDADEVRLHEPARLRDRLAPDPDDAGTL